MSRIMIGNVKGADGYTPQREVDYWTAGDKAEIGNVIDQKIGEIKIGAGTMSRSRRLEIIRSGNLQKISELQAVHTASGMVSLL